MKFVVADFKRALRARKTYPHIFDACLLAFLHFLLVTLYLSAIGVFG